MAAAWVGAVEAADQHIAPYSGRHPLAGSDRRVGAHDIAGDGARGRGDGRRGRHRDVGRTDAARGHGRDHHRSLGDRCLVARVEELTTGVLPQLVVSNWHDSVMAAR